MRATRAWYWFRTKTGALTPPIRRRSASLDWWPRRGLRAIYGQRLCCGNTSTNQIVVVNRSQASFTFAPAGGRNDRTWANANDVEHRQPAAEFVRLEQHRDQNSFSGAGTATNGCDLSGATPLAAGFSCGIVGTFQPQTVGALSATEIVSSNAINSPNSIKLSGTGIGLSTTTSNSKREPTQHFVDCQHYSDRDGFGGREYCAWRQCGVMFYDGTAVLGTAMRQWRAVKTAAQRNCRSRWAASRRQHHINGPLRRRRELPARSVSSVAVVTVTQGVVLFQPRRRCKS